VSRRYLLDTNVLSEPVRPRPSRRLMERLEEHEQEIVTASVVWHELLYGLHRLPRSARRTAIERYLNEVVAATILILPYDSEAAAWHAIERARLAGIGRTPPFVDGQVAAIAHVNDLIVVTRNKEDYAGFAGVRVEDWYG
jgi:tRNA(fMet)-specific endonuclease VapC